MTSTAPLSATPGASAGATAGPSGSSGTPSSRTPSGASSSGSAASPRRPRWLPSRRMVAYVMVVGTALVLLGVFAVGAARPPQFLDPEGAGPQGGRALAEVLRAQGVEVDVARSISALERAPVDRATTVVVADPGALGPGATERLRDVTSDAGRLVVVGGATEQLDTLEVPARTFPGGAERLRSRCTAAGARPNDLLRVIDQTYLLEDDDSGTSCFVLPDPDGDPDTPAPDAALGSALALIPPDSGRPETVLIGFGSALTNEFVADASHAGLGVRVLGSSERLVWYQPGTGDLTAPGPGGETGELRPIWPVWTTPAVVLVGIVVVLLAAARGRRLGRLVREPLPVVVRAVETTESRGRLYHRSGDRARAAEVLRAATRGRLAARLGLPRRPPFPAIVSAVSSCTGRSAEDVATILGGAPPGDDAALVQLARQLTDLEERARTS
ncbi:MAG: DUF4350 domain-containing protein [Dermatophilaceae bacterium]